MIPPLVCTCLHWMILSLKRLQCWVDTKCVWQLGASEIINEQASEALAQPSVISDYQPVCLCYCWMFTLLISISALTCGLQVDGERLHGSRRASLRRLSPEAICYQAHQGCIKLLLCLTLPVAFQSCNHVPDALYSCNCVQVVIVNSSGNLRMERELQEHFLGSIHRNWWFLMGYVLVPGGRPTWTRFQLKELAERYERSENHRAQDELLKVGPQYIALWSPYLDIWMRAAALRCCAAQWNILIWPLFIGWRNQGIKYDCGEQA